MGPRRSMLILPPILLLVIASCAGLTDRQQTQAQGAAVGTGIGAALGAGVGAIVGGKDGAALGAAIGGGTGLLDGTAYGTHVANQKAKYASEEAYLDAVLASARQVNSQAKQYNANLEREIKMIDAETVRLVQQFNRKMIEKRSLEAQKIQVAAKLSEASGELQKVNDELGEQKRALRQIDNPSSPKVAMLDEEIKKLERDKASLEGEVAKLATIKRRVEFALAPR